MCVANDGLASHPLNHDVERKNYFRRSYFIAFGLSLDKMQLEDGELPG